MCILGFHKWEGCKCVSCGKTRDEGHDWSKDCNACSRCGASRDDAHHWEGCKCMKCAKERHEWRDGVCAKCGKREKPKFIMAPHLGPGGLIIVVGSKSYPYTGDQAKKMFLGLAQQFDDNGQPLGARLSLQTPGGNLEITLEEAKVIMEHAYFIAKSGLL